MKLSIVLSTHATSFSAVAYQADLEASAGRMAALGYDGVELAVRDPDLLDAGSLHAAVARHGLAVPAIGTGQAFSEEGLSFTDPDAEVRRRAIERIHRHVDLARPWGAIVIIGLIRGRVQQAVGREQALGWLHEALSECTGYASQQGVRLALEPVNRYETNLIVSVSEGLGLISRIGADNLGLLLDTFHMNIEEPSIEESIRAAGAAVFHCHVADSNRWHAGAGHLDFASILSALGEVSYQGYLSAEVLPLPSPDECAQRNIDYLRRLLSRQRERG
jgi:sugar phosphate isomerase/epimerase